MGRGPRRPERADVLREIAARFPPCDRPEALAAVDIYVDEDDAARARAQLTILEHSHGNVERARELAMHRLMESKRVRPAPDPETRRNERYAG